jgi:hypothetical protein
VSVRVAGFAVDLGNVGGASGFAIRAGLVIGLKRGERDLVALGDEREQRDQSRRDAAGAQVAFLLVADEADVGVVQQRLGARIALASEPGARAKAALLAVFGGEAGADGELDDDEVRALEVEFVGDAVADVEAARVALDLVAAVADVELLGQFGAAVVGDLQRGPVGEVSEQSGVRVVSFVVAP